MTSLRKLKAAKGDFLNLEKLILVSSHGLQLVTEVVQFVAIEEAHEDPKEAPI
jgi:hypothetical protein